MTFYARPARPDHLTADVTSALRHRVLRVEVLRRHHRVRREPGEDVQQARHRDRPAEGDRHLRPVGHPRPAITALAALAATMRRSKSAKIIALADRSNAVQKTGAKPPAPVRVTAEGLGAFGGAGRVGSPVTALGPLGLPPPSMASVSARRVTALHPGGVKPRAVLVTNAKGPPRAALRLAAV